MKVINKTVLEDVADRLLYYMKRLDRFPLYADVIDALYFTLRSLGIEIVFSRYDQWLKVSCGDLFVTVEW